MNGIFNTIKSTNVIKRLEQLDPNSKPLWGKMSAASMLAHQIDALEVVLKIKKSAYPEGLSAKFLANPIGKWFVIYAPIPWPKGKIKGPPSFFVSESSNFENDRNRIIHLIQEFIKIGPQGDFGASPILGKLKPNQWADLLYRHFDHHLCQFAV